jgi:hypothetical protein
VLPPRFTTSRDYTGASPATTEQELAPTRPDFRRGSMHGWDAAIDALAMLLIGCGAQCADAEHTHAAPLMPPHDHPSSHEL